jgi:hypothetical protein
MTTIKSGLITLLICSIVSISSTPKGPNILKESIVGRWILVGYFPKKIDTFLHKELIVIDIDKDGMTTGFLGCNKFRTTCRIYQDSITFGTILYSRKFCNRTYMDMEDQLKTTLSKSNLFNIQEKTLILFEGKKKLASFQKIEYVHQP